jgi:hypothetical protein
MAVRAQEYALLDLAPNLLDPSCEATVRYAERLGLGLDVMELKGRQATSITADQALTALLLPTG